MLVEVSDSSVELMNITFSFNVNENAKIVKGRISVVLRGRDLKFWERSEKNNILRLKTRHMGGGEIK